MKSFTSFALMAIVAMFLPHVSSAEGAEYNYVYECSPTKRIATYSYFADILELVDGEWTKTAKVEFRWRETYPDAEQGNLHDTAGDRDFLGTYFVVEGQQLILSLGTNPPEVCRIAE